MGFEPTVPVKVQLISSQSRYDHFDTSPYMLTRIREVNALFNFIRILIRTQRVLKLLVCGKPAWLKALLSFDFSKQRNISSQARYDHFDTAPYMFSRRFSPPFSDRKGLWKELTERTANLFNFRTVENPHGYKVFGGRNGQLPARFRVSPVMTTSIPLRIC